MANDEQSHEDQLKLIDHWLESVCKDMRQAVRLGVPLNGAVFITVYDDDSGKQPCEVSFFGAGSNQDPDMTIRHFAWVCGKGLQRVAANTGPEPEDLFKGKGPQH